MEVSNTKQNEAFHNDDDGPSVENIQFETATATRPTDLKQPNNAATKRTTITTTTTTSNILAYLDRIDKQLSRPFFLSKLPSILECLLSIPGNWFGIPIVSTTITPSLVAILLYTTDDDDDFTTKAQQQQQPQRDIYSSWWILCVLLMFILTLSVWITLLRGNIKCLQIFYSFQSSALSPNIGLVMLLCMPPPSSSSSLSSNGIGMFQIAAWCIAVIPVVILKPLCGRIRPVAAASLNGDTDMESAAAKGKRLSILPKIISRDAYAAFPSGDVAGAVSFAYPLWRCSSSSSSSYDGVPLKYVAISCVLLSAFGRMYWQAHHLGDVIAGALISFMCCVMVEWYLVILNDREQHEDMSGIVAGCACRATWKQVMMAQLCLATTVIWSRKVFKKKIFGSGTISVQEENSAKKKSV